MESKKKKFPSFTEWAYKKSYFWIVFFIYVLISGGEEIVKGSIEELIGMMMAEFIFLTILFFIIYSIAKHTYKKYI